MLFKQKGNHFLPNDCWFFVPVLSLSPSNPIPSSQQSRQQFQVRLYLIIKHTTFKDELCNLFFKCLFRYLDHNFLIQ